MLLVVWHQKSYPSCEKSRFSTPKGLPGEFIEPRLTGGNNRNMMVKQIKTDNSRCLPIFVFFLLQSLAEMDAQTAALEKEHEAVSSN